MQLNIAGAILGAIIVIYLVKSRGMTADQIVVEVLKNALVVLLFYLVGGPLLRYGSKLVKKI